MTTITHTLTDDEKRALDGTDHTITVTITEFRDHGRYVRVRVPGGRFVLVPFDALVPA